MRELTKISREKNTYQLAKGEFHKGEWLKKIPDTEMIEIEYKGNNRILVVKNCEINKGD